MLQPGAIGLSCLFYALKMIYHNKALHNAFGILCFFHGTCHIGVLAGFVFWAAPITIWCAGNRTLHCSAAFRAPQLSSSRINQEVVAILAYFYYAATYAHVIKGLNRFVAVYIPMLYSRIFSTKGTLMIVGIGLLCAIGHDVPYHISTTLSIGPGFG